jgi:Xaa-Pro aminopeptidase
MGGMAEWDDVAGDADVRAAREAAGRAVAEAGDDRFRTWMTAGWAPESRGLPPRDPVADRAAVRRDRLRRALPGRTLVIPAGRPHVRSNDCDHRFRPHSAFTHLTGWGWDAVPGAVLVIPATGRAVLRFRPPAGHDTVEGYADPVDGAFWTGPRPGIDAVSARLGVTTADVAGLNEALVAASVTAPLAVLADADPAVTALADAIAPGRDRADDVRLADAASALRLIKDAWEVGQIRTAAAATLAGFEDVRDRLPRIVGHPRGERVVEGVFWARARELGNDVGYDTIAAAGEHACRLHWSDDDGPVRPGDLLLLDAGVELDSLYTADVTRTIPVSGRFTPAQRQVYDAVLAAADAAFRVAGPGVPFRALHEAAVASVAHTVADWGLVPVEAVTTLRPGWGLHRRFMVHGTSHHLGLDVHDCARVAPERYRDGVLEPGMVLTIEPGLYLQPDDELVPAGLRGIGVRIEDDVLVTADGVKSLTRAFPRTADEVEAWVAGRWPGR